MSETLTFLSRPMTKTISTINSATGHASLDIIRLDTSETKCIEDGLVLMVVSGKTLEVDRMQIYGKAIKDAGPHPEALGYYLNDPRPCHALEGNLKTNLAKLIIRFPPDCAATRFWHTKAFQDYTKPLGKNL